MSNILAGPFKLSQPRDLATALQAHVEKHFHDSSAHPDALRQDYDGIHRLRGAAVPVGSKAPDVHPNHLRDMLAYHAQLNFLASKFPLDIGLPFPWLPIFDSQGISPFPGMLPAQMPVSVPNLLFERACVLFNIGVMYASLGVAESRKDAEGIKRALAYFQNAAGCFEHLSGVVLPLLRLPAEYKEPCTPEFSKPALQAFASLYLAQAQECFWQKAVMDKLKNGTIAKLAAKVSELYEAAADSATEATQGGEKQTWPLFMFPFSMINHMRLKKAHFAAAAQYRKSCDDLSANRYGDEIGRLKYADQLASEGLANHKRSVAQAVQDDVKGLKAIVADNLKRATKDNDLIYLQPVTQPSNLPIITSASMVKSTVPPEIANPIAFLHASSGGLGRPFFDSLVPYSVHLAISIFDNRKEEFVRELESSANDHSQVAASTLQSLNLPGSINAIEQPQGLPPSLLAKAQDVRSDGGPQKAKAMFADVSRMSASNRSILDEARGLLHAEENEDAHSRMQFEAGRWARPASADLTGALRHRLAKYGETMDQATASDHLVRQKYIDWSDKIERLAGSPSDLEAIVPSFAPRTIFNASAPQMQAIRKIRSLLEQLEDVSAERKLIIDDTKRLSATDDIRPTVMREAGRMSSGGDLNGLKAESFESLFDAEMRKYEIYRHRMAQSGKQQEALLDKLPPANEAFLQARKSDPGLRERERVLQDLDMAHAKYHEVLVNLSEGLKFYSDFSVMLSQLRDQCKDFVQARRVEARDLLNAITAQINGLSLSGQAAPSPGHQDWQPGMPIRFG